MLVARIQFEFVLNGVRWVDGANLSMENSILWFLLMALNHSVDLINAHMMSCLSKVS